jgi:hypothetical protein
MKISPSLTTDTGVAPNTTSTTCSHGPGTSMSMACSMPTQEGAAAQPDHASARAMTGRQSIAMQAYPGIVDTNSSGMPREKQTG